MTIDQTNQQILEHLSKGLTAKEVSEKLCISAAMVKYRTRQLRLATGSKNNTELACWYKGLSKDSSLSK